jgi:hypothetical protein
MTLLRRLTRRAIPWLLAVLSLATAAPASAQEPFNGYPALVPVGDTYRGITLYSERETGSSGPGSDRYFLTQVVDDRAQRLPVGPRMGVPFDVDLGPDEAGDVVAVYSRCAIEPDLVRVRQTFGSRVFSDPYPAYTAGRGCDIYRYDVGTRQETRLEGASTSQASEVLPSVWRDQVAFARVYERRDGNRGVYPYLYVRPLDGGRSDRQPGGSRGTNGLPGPTRLDLYGRYLSFVWNYSTGEPRDGEIAGTTELRLDTIGGDNDVLSRARHGDDEPYASYLGPNGYRGRIFYGFGRAERRDGADFGLSAVLINERISTGGRHLSDSRLDGFPIDTTADSDLVLAWIDDDEFSYTGRASRIQTVGSAIYAE